VVRRYRVGHSVLGGGALRYLTDHSTVSHRWVRHQHHEPGSRNTVHHSDSSRHSGTGFDGTCCSGTHHSTPNQSAGHQSTRHYVTDLSSDDHGWRLRILSLRPAQSSVLGVTGVDEKSK
jgi:hypothetical protein